MRALTTPILLLAAAISLLAAPVYAEPVQADHVSVELIAENTSFAPGGENWVGLRIAPEQGWHVYWRNPGDTGLPTSLSWILPTGIEAGDPQWPYPQLEVTGDIVNYGYERETLLPVALKIPADFSAATTLNLQAKARWLVCKDICIPGSADLSLAWPATAAGQVPQADPHWRELFASARAALPQPAPADWKLQFAAHGGDFSLSVAGAQFSADGGIAFFPYSNTLVRHSAPQRVANRLQQGQSTLRLSQALSTNFVKAPSEVEGVLVVHDGDAVKAWEIRAKPGTVTPVPLSAASSLHPQGAAAASAGFLKVMLLALLGGLVLNLMPCVFPVLSIKALSLVEARGAVARHQRGHALAYTAGVLLMFAALAGLLMGLRSAGEAVGWGFQLQQPVFVAALVYLFFAMGLSLSGLVQFGTRLMGLGQTLASGRGYRGSFFTGLLAVAVASPCITPFVGTALGYALSQPGIVAFSVFLVLGLGLALPFLLIGFFPRLGAFLPKPGHWMETFRQAMAFPLYLTAVGLLWVLGGLTDRGSMALVLVGVVLLAFALWLWNRPGSVAVFFKTLALAGALALLGLPQLRTVHAAAPVAAAPGTEQPGTPEPWSAQRVEELRAQGRTIFVNFTADWCVTCKFNEHVALRADSVAKAFADNGVVWLEGDWTRGDPDITEVLERFGSPGVPLYLVYPKGGEPKVLPQNLTPSIVIGAVTPN